MNKEETAHDASDSSDDEDFCPEKETGTGASEVSEDDDDDDDDESFEEEQPDESISNNKQKKEKSCKGRRKKLRKRKSKDEAVTDDSEVEDCSTDETRSRRQTRQTAETSRQNGNSVQEKQYLESDEDENEKSRKDALWADFLSDVKEPPAKPTTREPKKSTTNNSNKSADATTSSVVTKPSNGVATSKTEAPKEIVVTEVHDFAGEEVHVKKTLNTDSIKENKSNIRAPPASATLKRPAVGSGAGGGAGGLGSILGQIGKKKKISVLEKSKLDWNSFKEDEGIEEQLQTFNKGKDGYLERQDFLQRTDLRQFEIEKNLRQTRRNI